MKPNERFVMLLTFICVGGRKPRQEFTSKAALETEDYDAGVFCKSKERLISSEKSDEIVVVDTLPGSSILMQCKYCEERDNGLPKIWNVQRQIFTGDITEVELSMNSNLSVARSFVTKNHSLVLRNVQENDLALYLCKTPCSNTPKNSFNYLVDFVNTSNDDVKGAVSELSNYTQCLTGKIDKIVSRMTFSEDPRAYLKVFTDWSSWSKCDSYFRKERFRHRRGKCKIKFFLRSSNKYNSSNPKYKQFNRLKFNDNRNLEKLGDFDVPIKDIYSVKRNIMNMGIGLSCKSFWLRILYPEVYNITSKVPDFVLKEKCKLLFPERSTNKGPRYRKSIILATGAHLTLVCSDSTIESQVQWVHDGVQLFPNNGTDYIPKSGEPRLYVDSFNTLYLFEVTSKESGNYTCFVDGLRMQEVNIIVLTRSLFFTKEFTRHLKYLGYLFVLCFVAYLAGMIITFVKIQSEKRVKKSPRKNEKRPLCG